MIVFLFSTGRELTLSFVRSFVRGSLLSLVSLSNTLAKEVLSPHLKYFFSTLSLLSLFPGEKKKALLRVQYSVFAHVKAH